MTEPVREIDGVRESGRKESRGGMAARGKGERHPRRAEDDSVDISEEARHRSEDADHEGGRGHGGKRKD